MRNAYFRSKAAELEPIYTDKTGRRYWDLLTDSALYLHAMAFVSENHISDKQGIADLDAGLYAVLSKRKLFDYCFLDECRASRIDWKGMGNQEFLDFVHGLISEEGIKRSGELRKKHPAIGMAISRKGLSASVKYPERGHFFPIRGKNCPLHKEKAVNEDEDDI
ncbi:MAG: hypothetical protein ACP5N9_03260 [Candidatus Bilamarchaeum sp.]